MKVRRYQARISKPNPFRPWRDCLEDARRECIARARAELGPDAVFLNEETRTEESLMGLKRREIVEMMFATELEGTALDGQGKPLPLPSPSGKGSRKERNSEEEPAPSGDLAGEVRDLKESMRTLIREVSAGGIKHPETSNGSQASGLVRHAELRARLVDAEVPEPLIEQLLARIPDRARGDAALRALHAAVRDTFRTTRMGEPTPQQTKVIALVGPTGVGKTTTIAKLAAPYALSGKLRVGLVTLDTYRIAAVEQLRTYADIMDVPVRVAHGRRDIAQALASLPDRDIIFLDTAGRSQKNWEKVQEMERTLAGISCEPHLVLSATSKPRDLLESAREFSVVRPRSLVVTKLDETNTLGPLLGLVAETGLPLSYVTVGQRVPEDIEPADADRLATRLLESMDGSPIR